MAPPPRYMQMVAASRDEASLAVRLYNDPAEIRSFGRDSDRASDTESN